MSSIQGNLSDERYGVVLPPAASKFVRYVEQCYRQDPDIPSFFLPEVRKACLLVSRICSPIDLYRKRLDPKSWSQIFRRKEVPAEIVDFLELVERLENIDLFPTECVERLHQICLWMQNVKPAATAADPSELRKKRSLEIQKALPSIKLPNLGRPEGYRAECKLQEFILECEHAFPSPIPADQRKEVFESLIDHVLSMSKVPPCAVRRFKSNLQLYLRACVDPEAAAFRRLWLLLTVPDEDLEAIISADSDEVV